LQYYAKTIVTKSAGNAGGLSCIMRGLTSHLCDCFWELGLCLHALGGTSACIEQLCHIAAAGAVFVPHLVESRMQLAVRVRL